MVQLQHLEKQTNPLYLIGRHKLNITPLVSINISKIFTFAKYIFFMVRDEVSNYLIIQYSIHQLNNVELKQNNLH